MVDFIKLFGVHRRWHAVPNKTSVVKEVPQPRFHYTILEQKNHSQQMLDVTYYPSPWMAWELDPELEVDVLIKEKVDFTHPSWETLQYLPQNTLYLWHYMLDTR